MTTFQVRYWFDSSSREKSGEQITEIVEADNPHTVAKRVQDFLATSSFVITPSFGPANSGFVIIHTAQVRYVEVIPAQPGSATPTVFVTSAMELP